MNIRVQFIGNAIRNVNEADFLCKDITEKISAFLHTYIDQNCWNLFGIFPPVGFHSPTVISKYIDFNEKKKLNQNKNPLSFW